MGKVAKHVRRVRIFSRSLVLFNVSTVYTNINAHKHRHCNMGAI